MNYRKIIQKEIPEKSRELVEYIKDPLLCDLLRLRGINSRKDAEEFLECKKASLTSLDVFNDCEKVTKRIKKAIAQKEKILVWGDFDADGVTSSALMYKTLDKLGANFEIFIPEREKHGHGLNSKKALEYISKHKIKVLITVDCGISNASEVKLIKSFGVDVIITDHHKLDGETPQAFAILNPQVPNSLKDDLDIRQIENLCQLAGVGIAYKLALKLLEKEKDDELLILACIGTISDVVPLLGENRTIVSNGLKLINKNQHKGISMLFKSVGRENITSNDIAFVLTPRINAVGRLSTPELAFEFLTEESESALNFILEKLDNFNKIRQSLCENIYFEASDMAKDTNETAIVLYDKNWHIGIIGIVAAKILEDYSKPVFMITSNENNIGRCSIRSIEGYNVYEILKSNSNLFLGYGGHALAGGFSFDMNTHSFDEIKQAILNTIEELNVDTPVKNYLEADKFLSASEITKELTEKINVLEPYGQGNPSPVFALKDAQIKDIRTIGKNLNHLKFRCEQNGTTLECVSWNENSLLLPENAISDIAFAPKLNIFNNEEKIQLEIIDIYSSKYQPKNNCNNVKIYDHRKKEGILTQICEYLKKDGLDVTIWAKNIKTIENIKKYPEIEKRIYRDKRKHKSIMFFDYPSTMEELGYILKEIKPNKIHFMNDNFNENIETCLKTLSGMLKYAHNHKDGEIDIYKLANACGTSESFVQIALELFEQIGAIEILDIDKITYIEPANTEKLAKQSLYEILCDEFDKITDFKKHLAEDNLDKMYKLVNFCLN